MDTNLGKSYFWILIDLLVVAVIINLVFFVMPTIRHYGDSLYPTRTMTVSADGKTTVTPDTAVTSFSVVSRGKNPQDLATNNNEKVSAAIQFVKSQGIEAKDITTTGYNLSPDYQYDQQTQRSYITGYTLTQTVTVKIRKIEKVAVVIGGLTPLGVNQIGGVSFTIDEPEKYLTQARADAFAKAQKKAAEIAQESGVRLARIVNVGEYQGGPPPIPYYSMGMGGAKVAESTTPAPTIEPGSQEVTVSVTLTYELQ